jgi:hypothetical protein
MPIIRLLRLRLVMTASGRPEARPCGFKKFISTLLVRTPNNKPAKNSVQLVLFFGNLENYFTFWQQISNPLFFYTRDGISSQI